MPKIDKALAALNQQMEDAGDALEKGMDTEDYSMSAEDGDEDGEDDEGDDDGEADDDTQDDDGDGDDDDMGKSHGDDDDEIEKSLDGGLTADLQKAIDATPVLAHFASSVDGLRDGVDEAFGGLQNVMVKSMGEQEVVNEALLKGIASALQMVKSLTGEVAAMSATIHKLAGAPRPRKAAVGAVPAEVLEKSVGGSPPATTGRFAKSFGMHPSVMQQKLIKGITTGLVPEKFMAHFDLHHTVPESVFGLIKDI